ncbi:hypothetical protein JCM21142_134744 [Saccharicrinis fermentans DSM 9555 = JCM 21142]|uniref:Uncharacterized protein n=1 Tax=Saccharicrinis fermentans DSM 9555 = JCM 21142 TaxID=869213 RepID=W7YU48_9BACT|nr:hypothetical protein JCM21142_134744 [Saccharicrinis fermentans DSM 9555 = JCM 21142]
MKRRLIFFNICYVSTILTLVMLVSSSILSDVDIIKPVFYSPLAISLRGVSLLLLFILLIKCIIVWKNKDKT